MTPHKREVMQMALNALEIYGAQAPAVNDTIEALHACLAQPEHWSDCAVHSEPAYPKGECDCGGMRPEQKEQWFAGYKAGYAQAQETDLAMPRKAWVGLADWEIDDVQYDVDCRLHRSYARAIEAKLKEKNA